MSLRTLIFYGLIAVIPAYFFNKWLQKIIRPRESLGRLAIFIVVILAAAFAYTAAAVLLFMWFAESH